MKTPLFGLAAIVCLACTSTDDSAIDLETDQIRKAGEESARRYQQELEESRLSKRREDAKWACYSVFRVVTEGCVNILRLRWEETTESAINEAFSCLNGQLYRTSSKGHPDCNEPIKTNSVNFSWEHTEGLVCLAVAEGAYRDCLKGVENILPDKYQNTAGERR